MKKILCIAHRGSSAYKPENTIKAFEKAIDQSADCIELDVLKTADNQLIVYHDICLQNGDFVKDQNFETVKAEAKLRGINVPTLDEVFYRLNNRIKLNLEIKSPGVVDLLIKKLKNYDNRKIICSSFIHSILLELKEKAPGISRAPIIGCRSLNPIKLLDNIKSGILVQNYEFIDHSYVDLLHKKNKLIFVYTVNRIPTMIKMIKHKVDGIITDYPDILNKLINKSSDLDQSHRSEALAY